MATEQFHCEYIQSQTIKMMKKTNKKQRVIQLKTKQSETEKQKAFF